MKLYFISSVNKIRCNDLLGVSSSGSASFYVIILSICVLSLVDWNCNWNWNWVTLWITKFRGILQLFCWRSCRISCRSVGFKFHNHMSNKATKPWLVTFSLRFVVGVLFFQPFFIHVCVCVIVQRLEFETMIWDVQHRMHSG